MTPGQGIFVATAPFTLFWVGVIFYAAYAGESEPDQEMAVNTLLAFVPIVVHVMCLFVLAMYLLEQIADVGVEAGGERRARSRRTQTRQRKIL